MRTRYIAHAALLAAVVMSAGCSTLGTTSGPAGAARGAVKRPMAQWDGTLPGVPPEAEYADFWIRRASDPDALVMTPDEIARFNEASPSNGADIRNVLDLPAELDGGPVRSYLAENARWFIDADFYVHDGIPLEPAERKRIVALVDTASVPDVITTRYGLMLRREMGLIWPTAIPFMNDGLNSEFSRNIVSSVDMNDPVALLHTSADGRWCYVQHDLFTCWVPSDAVAFGYPETIALLRDTTNTVLAVGHRVTVYADPEAGIGRGSIQMGTMLPISAMGNSYYEVLVPGRDEHGSLVAERGYVRRSSDIHVGGHLPYTLRNVYSLAFSLYGRRYGWGGMYEERDCSRYIMDIFRCFGIRLPRNSTKQGLASTAVIDMEGMDPATKLQAVLNSPAGITLLRKPGHIMLYLGDIDGVPYMIHQFYSWHWNDGGAQANWRVGRVQVTGVLLGEGTPGGSFVDVLTNAAIIGNYEITY